VAGTLTFTIVSVLVLSSDPTVACYRGAHLPAVVIAWACLVAFVAGLPAGTAAITCARLAQSAPLAAQLDTAHDRDAPAQLQAPPLRALFASLEFRPSQWPFRPLQQILSVVLVMLQLAQSRRTSSAAINVFQAAATCLSLAAFGCALAWARPYPRHAAWQLGLHLLSLLVTGMAAILNAVTVAQASDGATAALAYACLTLAVALLAALVLLFVRNTVESARREEAQLRAEKLQRQSASQAGGTAGFLKNADSMLALPAPPQRRPSQHGGRSGARPTRNQLTTLSVAQQAPSPTGTLGEGPPTVAISPCTQAALRASRKVSIASGDSTHAVAAAARGGVGAKAIASGGTLPLAQPATSAAQRQARRLSPTRASLALLGPVARGARPDHASLLEAASAVRGSDPTSSNDSDAW